VPSRKKTNSLPLPGGEIQNPKSKIQNPPVLSLKIRAILSYGDRLEIMENKKPLFGIQGYSPIRTVSQLHSYCRDMQSYYQVAKGDLLGKLEKADGEEEIRLQQELAEITRKIQYFHVLNNAVSIADTVFHTPEMIAEFRDDA
jgi:hypothetical protein